MNSHKLNENEMQTIGHFIAQRCITGTNEALPLEISKSVNIYLETYNNVIEKLKEYNDTIS